MDETGKVIKISGNDATVQFERKTACKNCGMCFASSNEKNVELTLENKVGAELGDTVKVSSNSSGVVKSMLLVYGIPLLIFFVGLIIAQVAFQNEIVTFIVGFAALFIGFFILNKVDKRIGRNKASKILPEIVGIEKSAKEENIDKNSEKEII